MCGIFAVISKKYNKETQSIFKQLMYVGTLRGWDGAGLFRVRHQDVTVFKQPGPAVNLLNYINKAPETSLFAQMLVGHNRASTKGANTEINTHPFQEKNITLVHNGTLWNHKQLENTDNDSHAICHYLTNHTPQEFIDVAFGAYALVWYDDNKDTLFFMRNDERPLYIIHTEDLTVLVSEKLMGEWILTRNNIAVHNVEEVKPFTLYSIKKNDLHTITKQVLNEPVKTFAPSTQPKKPEVKKEEKVKPIKKDKVLPQTKSTQNILESLENRGLKKNDLFTAYCYTSEVLGESFKNFAVADFDPQEEIIFYSREPFEGFNVRLIFKNLIDNVENNSYYIFATGAEAIEQEFVPKTTMNGVIVTEKVHKFLTGKGCGSCGVAYNIEDVPKAEIHTEETFAGFVYKYTYTCPTCAK